MFKIGDRVKVTCECCVDKNYKGTIKEIKKNVNVAYEVLLTDGSFLACWSNGIELLNKWGDPFVL